MVGLDFFKRLFARTLRSFTSRVPIRGRHRLVNWVGRILATEPELISIGGLYVLIDHRIAFCRYAFYGVYEEHLTNWIAANIHNGDAVLEPGTNIGYIAGHLLRAVGHRGRLYCLEPSRTCYDMLAENNALSQIPNLRLENAALSSTTGTLTFCDTGRVVAFGYSCLATIATPEDSTQYPVTTYTVDDFCRQHNIERLRFLKLDIEGSENDALIGAAAMLEAGRIDFIMLETTIDVTDRRACDCNRDIRSALEPRGYRPYRMLRNGCLKTISLDNISKGRLDIMWARIGIEAT